MRSQLYHSIFTRKGFLEYHVSDDKEPARHGESMCRRIPLDSDPADVDAAQARWINEAEGYRSIRVEYKERDK